MGLRRAPSSRWRQVTLVAGVALAVTLIVAPPTRAASSGGVNTGIPGSTCAPDSDGVTYTAPGAGVSTTALGPAPAYYELGAPAGAFTGQAPKGLMLVIHGGAWFRVGPGFVAQMRPVADSWRDRGWETLNIDYRACSQSLSDVLWFHDRARVMAGNAMPMCVAGFSAGGHLALMLANLRPDVACVDAEGAPTDLTTIASQPAYDPATGRSDQTAGPAWIQNLAAAAFGSDQLPALSPARAPRPVRLLLATAAEDEYIPWAQAQGMANAVASTGKATYVDLDQLAAGTFYEFTHTDLSKGTGVSKAAYDDYLVRQLQLVAPLTAPAGTTASVVNDIRVPAMGGASIGDEEFDTVTGTSSTHARMSGRVLLGAGPTYRIQSCIGYFDPVRAPQGWCSQSTIATAGAPTATGYPLPSVSSSWANPAPGTGRGFAVAFVTVSYLSNGTWTAIASSRPDIPTEAGTWIP